MTTIVTSPQMTTIMTFLQMTTIQQPSYTCPLCSNLPTDDYYSDLPTDDHYSDLPTDDHYAVTSLQMLTMHTDLPTDVLVWWPPHVNVGVALFKMPSLYWFIRKLPHLTLVSFCFSLSNNIFLYESESYSDVNKKQETSQSFQNL